MGEYIPWLIPLLGKASCKTKGLQSPLEEEQALRTVMESNRIDWPAVADLVLKEYGIPLIHGLNDPCTLLAKGEGKGTRNKLRFLVLKRLCRELFVLNHPEGIDLFDRHAVEGQEIALAQPSLFRRLWLQEPSRITNREELHRLRSQHNPGMEAFSLFMREIIGSKNPSDWHLEATPDHYRSRIRVHGKLVELERLTHEKAGWVINSLIACCGLPEQIVNFPLEGSFDISLSGEQSIPARCSIIPTIYGLAVAIRFLERKSLVEEGLRGLGIPAGKIAWLESRFQGRDGFWLVAGPTGSGKSTTLHSLLNWSVQAGEKVLAVEDPVERTLESVQQVSVDDPPGLTFADALKAFLRQSPDTILVGEIRDSETAAIALQASRTGHRVLSTLHAGTIPGIFSRLQDLGQTSSELEQTGRVIILQRLVPLLCQECARRRSIPPDIRASLLEAGLAPPQDMAMATGCPACTEGITGRTGIFSITSFQRSAVGNSQLLKAAWELFVAGRIELPILLPFLPQ